MPVEEESHTPREVGDRDNSWDRAVDVLAYAALLGAGAYAGVKYFPTYTLKRAHRQMARILGRTRLKGDLPGLLGRYGRVTAKSQAARQAPQWKFGRPPEMSLLHELETAIAIFRKDSRISGSAVDDVTRAIMSRHASDIPQAVGSRTPATMADFFSRGTGVEKLISSQFGQGTALGIQEQFSHLSQLPGFRQSLSRLGVTVEEFQRRAALGGHIAIGAQGAEYARQGLGALFRDISGLSLPFLSNWRPLELLYPEAGGAMPGVSLLGKKAGQAMFGGKTKNVLFAAGKLYPIEGDTGRLLIGRPSAGYRLASTRTGMAKGAAARMGLIKPFPMATGDMEERIKQAMGLPKWQQDLLRTQRRYGVGPEWSARRSVWGGFYQRLKAIATGAKPEILTPTGTPAAGITPTGAYLRGRLGRKMGAVGGVEDLSWFERLRLRLGGEIKRPFMREGRYGPEFVSKTVARLKGMPSQTKRVARPFGSRLVRKGAPDLYEQVPYYAHKKGAQGWKDWMNYQINRPLWLLSETTGLGVKPGRSPLQSLGQIGLKMAVPAYLSYQALWYAEYKSNRLLGAGPISAPAWMYTRARMGLQGALDSAGVTEMMTNLEEQFPGSIDSPVSRGVRGAASVLAGAYGARHFQSKYGKMAAAATGMIGGWLQLAGINRSADELSQIYSGEREVPVRSGRWWMLGRQPLGGGKIKYFEPGWYKRLTSGYKEIATYGSRQAAWRGSWLPTPENWFLLKNVYDPYYAENVNYYDRPYPKTSPLFGDIPLVGPAAAETVGRLIKPVQRREVPVGVDPYDIPDRVLEGQAAAVSMGKSLAPAYTDSPRDLRLAIMTGDTLYRLFDWTGLPGFMVGAIKEQLTGSSGWYDNMKVTATSGAITSAQRDYYDRNLGGMIGMNEFFRRFVPRAQHFDYWNPLPNASPEWLPGSKSVFSGDRDNYVNFGVGDPMTKIEKGEMRLPGPGYDAIHDVGPGMTDALTRYQILADVAPASQAYKQHRRMIHGMIETGAINKDQIKRFAIKEEQVAERFKSQAVSAGYRYRSEGFKTMDVTVRSTGPSTFTTTEHPGMRFHLAGVEGRTYAMEGAQDKYGQLRRRLAEYRGKSVSMTYGGFGLTTPAVLGDANEYAIGLGLGKERPLDNLDYQAKHGPNFMNRSYEWLTQSAMPSVTRDPISGWARTKFFGEQSSIDNYERFMRSGTWDTGWEHPYQNYIKPWFNQAAGTISTERLQARQINEYFDNFKYVKYRRLEEQAQAMGAADTANKFAEQRAQTLVGSNPYAPGFYKNVFKALPPSERPYFSSFAGVAGEAAQERILNAVPENMAPILIGTWDRRAGTDGFSSPILTRYAEEARRQMETSPDAQVAGYFAHHSLPDDDYMGWHPAVDDDTIKIRMAQQEALDIHRLGMWETQARQTEEMFPTVGAPDMAGGSYGREELIASLQDQGFQDVSAMHGFPEDPWQFRFQRSRRKRWMDAYRMLIMQGAA